MPNTRQRRQTRHRAMLLWALALFGTIQIGASLLFDYIFPRVRFGMLYRKLDRLAELQRAPTIVCLGSSRTEICLMDVDLARQLRQLGAEPTTDVLNAGVPCGDAVTSAVVLEELLRRCDPRLVLIEICPEFLHEEAECLQWQVRRVARWHETLDYVPPVSIHGRWGLFAETRLLALSAYRTSLFDAVRDWREHQARQGRWQAGSFAWEDRVRRSWERARQADHKLTTAEKQAAEREWREKAPHFLADYQPIGRGLHALEAMLDHCEERGIRALLWIPPLASVRRQAYRPEVEQVFGVVMDRLRRRYGCAFHDARAALRDEEFIDTNHATAEGALAFSQRFCRAVLAPVWFGTEPDSSMTQASALRTR